MDRWIDKWVDSWMDGYNNECIDKVVNVLKEG